MKKGKLELTWVGKHEEKMVEPRILIEDEYKSFFINDTENKIIQGDNLIALKALEHDYTGKIKCIYIDPPYNTKSAFESYDDNLEHSIWLNMMRDRLKILWNLLSDDNGVLLISINDDECHYLKVMCDELFGRGKFITSLIWNYEGNTDNQAKIINYHEYILVYSKTGELDNLNVIDPNVSNNSKLFKKEIRNTIIKNGPKNPMSSVIIPKGFPASFENGEISVSKVNYPKYNENVIVKDFKVSKSVEAVTGWSSKNLLINFTNNNFAPINDAKGQETTFEMKETGAIEVVKKRKQDKGHFVSVLRGFGTTNQMRIFLESLGLKFSYPKPIDLIAYLIEAFTGPNDYVLDSFAGSGTTADAVIKLNNEKNSKRKYLIIELSEDNAENVILPRLLNRLESLEVDKRAINGFKYYNLAESLLVKNKKLPVYSINPNYTFDMIAEAICKIEGFNFKPIGRFHGRSSERRFIHITTEYVNAKYLYSLLTEVKEKQSLLVYCSKVQSEIQVPDNVEIKRIPKDLLDKCTFEEER